MKKGRHRRFEEARALKRTSDDFDTLFTSENGEPCAECGAEPGEDHASWCLAESADVSDEPSDDSDQAEAW